MTAAAVLPNELLAAIERHWGFPSLRPLQEQAMRAVLDGRDSLVVLPTGGGKSLCYQAPAVLRGGTTVVVSPLIALMKDQVDGLTRLRRPGGAARQLADAERAHGRTRDPSSGAEPRLVFVSPERLVNTDVLQLLRDIGVHTFAIDEAHCISHWGHDFRPEYRQLRRLREFFPERRRPRLHRHRHRARPPRHRRPTRPADPQVLVGNFDRPNLTYRVLPRLDVLKQVREVLERHKGEAGIIYCLRRRDVDDAAGALRKQRLSRLCPTTPG